VYKQRISLKECCRVQKQKQGAFSILQTFCAAFLDLLVNISVSKREREEKTSRNSRPRWVLKMYLPILVKMRGPGGPMRSTRLGLGPLLPNQPPHAKINKGTFARASRGTCIIYEGKGWLGHILIVSCTATHKGRQRGGGRDVALSKELGLHEWKGGLYFAPKNSKWTNSLLAFFTSTSFMALLLITPMPDICQAPSGLTANKLHQEKTHQLKSGRKKESALKSIGRLIQAVIICACYEIIAWPLMGRNKFSRP
jgi:hypothetical protein